MEGRRLRDAFGAFPTGVVAVAARLEGGPTGLAASSFTSVSMDPPLVSISIAKRSATWPELRRADRLGVTVLSEAQGVLCHQLSGPASERFAGVAWEVTDRGAVLLADGLAQYDCSIREELDAGDHLIVLLDLHAAAVHEGVQPLIFHRSRFGRLA